MPFFRFFSPILLLFSGCAVNDRVTTAIVPPAPVASADMSMPADPDPALWVVKDDDTTIYLFGTIHLLKPDVIWFDEAVKTAFDASDELVIEMVQPEAAEMMEIVSDLTIDETGVPLRSKLEPAQRVKFEAALAGLGLPAAAFDPVKPWFAAVTLSLAPLLSQGYDPNKGVEDDLQAAAKARNIPVIGLETAPEQLGFFDKLPEATQLRFLNVTVDSLPEAAQGTDEMVALWARGNIEALAAKMNEGLEDPELYKTLLSDRNANWAAWIKTRLAQPGTVFLAVGAGHLSGSSSVQDMLRKDSLEAVRIDY